MVKEEFWNTGRPEDLEKRHVLPPLTYTCSSSSRKYEYILVLFQS